MTLPECTVNIIDINGLYQKKITKLIYNSKAMVALSTWSLRETTQSFMTASSSSEVTKAVRHTISTSAIFMKADFGTSLKATVLAPSGMAFSTAKYTQPQTESII